MSVRNLPKHRARFQASSIVILLITAYQKTLSPDHGPLKHLYPYGYCRHSPTCSQYAKEQLEKRGLIMGTLYALKQLVNCHPFSRISDAKWKEIAEKQTSSLQDPI
jgi:putative component of membrane protein insertase Oxa1/YidC/SpoIIIJ protein YidD